MPVTPTARIHHTDIPSSFSHTYFSPAWNSVYLSTLSFAATVQYNVDEKH